VLKLENVSKEFGGLTAVNDFSLELESGRLTGLIGPNGAGKTTVTNLISGLMSLTTGSITLDGTEIGTMEPDRIARAGVARTFQTSRLFGRMSVMENVMVAIQEREKDNRVGIFGNLVGTPRAYRQQREWREGARELLARLELSGLEDEKATALPYGGQRRLEIARALALKPKVLLLDEPIAGMTDAEAKPLGDIFTEVCREGIAVLLIEHNVPFVMRICDEVHVLSYGELIASGKPEVVINEPAVVDAYLGS
jgi:branched-chain amino acid transport system ATP-binding protein